MTKEQTFAHPPRGHVALLAYDSANDRFQVVHVDASGLLQVDIAAQAIDVEVTQVTPADLVVAAHGYDGAAWRKQPPIWGYSDRYVVQQQNVSDVAGDYTINLPAVPAGEVWRVLGLAVYRGTNVNQYARLQVIVGVSAYSVEDIAIPTLGRFFPGAAELVLKAVDNVRVIYTGATVGEVVITVASGYKMSIAL